jgi:Flp pilus assembly protein TadG
MRAAMNGSKLASRMASWARFARDRRGVSAIEFAMIAPLLILMYVGLAEVGNALTIYRRAATVAMTAADLTAQTKSLKTADLKDIVGASSSILAPYAATSPTPLKIVISSVVADQNNSGKVAWSYASNGATARGVNSAYTVPNGLTEAGTSVIVSEITYAFTPLLDLPQIFSPGAFDIKRTFYSRPRRSLTVTKTD